MDAKHDAANRTTEETAKHDLQRAAMTAKLRYESPKVESISLSTEAAEAMT